jgi:GNAT superfamily N-acetyltransferase
LSATVVRKGLRADVPVALELIRELAAYERAAGEVVVTVKEMEDWGFGPERVFDFFVAEKDGVIIGLALYYFKYSTWKGKCLFLEDIIVKEAERCKGVGTMLMKEIIAIARAQGLRRLEWQVLNWNTPAIRFYEKYRAAFDSEWINCRLVPGNY